MVRAQDCQPRGPGTSGRAASLKLSTLVIPFMPFLPVAFGGDTKSCWSFLRLSFYLVSMSGEVKYLTQGWDKYVIGHGLTPLK